MKTYLALISAAVLALSACSQEPAAPAASESASETTAVSEATPASTEAAPASETAPEATPQETAPAPAAAASAANGKAVFEQSCQACHGANSPIPGIPRITKNDEWKDRIAQGKDVLVKHAIEGFTGKSGAMMPAKGGNTSLSDEEVAAAVVYMANESGAKF